jgi:hypothetical protein
MRLRLAMTGGLVLPLATLAVTGLPGGHASAATTPLPMNGEFLSSIPAATTTSGTCDPSTGGTFSFTISGVASGPYTGTFTESGTVTLGPQNIPNPLAPGQFRAEVLSFSADFTITSALGTVTGHKELPSGAGQPVDSGNAGGCLTTSGLAISQVLTSRLTYTATTPTGDDSGSSFVDMNTYPVPPTGGSSNEFREGFSSSNPTTAPQCADGVDNDGDGKVDYPADPGCSSATDDSESPDPVIQPQCSDGVDNDADGKVDYPADPGCSSATDNTESPDPVPTTPTSTDQCKKDGWKTFTSPAFKNQGDCVSFVATKGKNT